MTTPLRTHRTAYPKPDLVERQLRITTTQDWTVPTGILGNMVLVTACSAGGGGCSGGVEISGFNTHYNAGGSSGVGVIDFPLLVSPSDTLTLTLGAPGAGGTAVSRSTGPGTSNGNPGGDADPLTIEGTGISIILPGGVGGAWASNGAGAPPTVDVEPDCWCAGGDGSDSSATGDSVGPNALGANGTTAGSRGYGGYGGGASAFGKGGDGGDGVSTTGSPPTPDTAESGEDGQWGAGGGAGGCLMSTVTGTTLTSGAGGDGGPAFVLLTWWEAEQ